MKKLISVLIGLFLVVVPILAQGTVDDINALDTTAAVEPVAYINYLEGEVFFQGFEKAELNMIIQEGYELTIKEGRVEILLKGSGIIRLDRNTRVVFAALTDQMIILEVWSGNIYVEKGSFEIGVKSPNRSLNLSQSEWYFAEPEKSFKKWNNTRDEELNLSDNQYLPEELNRYGNTLNRYGSWRQYDSYGYVWIPRVSYGWRPYYYGRWIHIPVLGWFWISDESFGWSVYHYGRWQWDVGFGWYWIPTRYWGPSWVYWYNYGDYYAWSPMGYGSRYYRDHWNRYGYGRLDSHVWSVVHKNQLRSRNISKSVISKSELARTPRISQNQLRTSISSSNVATSRSISKIMRTTPTTTNTNNRIFRNRVNQNNINQSSKNSTRINSLLQKRSPESRSKITRSSDRKIYSPYSRISIQRKNSEPINSRNSRVTSPFTRNTVSPSRSYSPRTSTLNPFRTLPRISSRSFLSPSRSFSKPPLRSPSRPIQKNIRKK